MAWERLPVNYTDAVWSGLKRYSMVNNEDGTVSFQDVTVYLPYLPGRTHSAQTPPRRSVRSVLQAHPRATVCD